MTSTLPCKGMPTQRPSIQNSQEAKPSQSKSKPKPPCKCDKAKQPSGRIASMVCRLGKQRVFFVSVRPTARDQNFKLACKFEPGRKAPVVDPKTLNRTSKLKQPLCGVYGRNKSQYYVGGSLL